MIASVAITGCRSCAATALVPVLDLGRTPLANALPLAGDAQPEQAFPLQLVLCTACSLLQITETVPPESLFSNYLYRSSFSDDFLRHAAAIAARMIASRQLGPTSLVCEVASNDGYLLQFYHREGIPVLGIEPATNIAAIAVRERGVRTINEFFGEAVGQRLAAGGERADVVHANNVLAHVADLNGFVAGMRALVKDDGVVVSESPYVRDFVDGCEFDTIYHEHLCYYSLTALSGLFARHDLTIVDCEWLPVHGGSLRIFASPSARAPKPSAAIAAMLAEEARSGIATPGGYALLAERAARIRGDLLALLRSLRAEGARIAAYGAAAKGSTLLNYCGIDDSLVDFIADRSPLKQGRRMPGVRIPIVAPGEILARQPTHLLLLAWNFADEIMIQQAEFRAAGGKFILPVPSVRVV